MTLQAVELAHHRQHGTGNAGDGGLEVLHETASHAEWSNERHRQDSCDHQRIGVGPEPDSRTIEEHPPAKSENFSSSLRSRTPPVQAQSRVNPANHLPV